MQRMLEQVCDRVGDTATVIVAFMSGEFNSVTSLKFGGSICAETYLQWMRLNAFSASGRGRRRYSVLFATAPDVKDDSGYAKGGIAWR